MHQPTRCSRPIGLALLGAALAAPSFAQTPFSWELGGSYAERTQTISVPTFTGTIEDEIDFSAYALSAQWFFAPVRTDLGPLERAPFLARASSVTFNFAQSEVDATDFDNDTLALAGRYQLGEDWFVTGNASQSDANSAGFESEVDTYGIGVGLYVAQNTSVAFRVARSDVEFQGSRIDDVTTYVIDLEHLGGLSESAWQYAVDASLSVPDGEFDRAGFNTALTLYPTPELSFGASLRASIQDTSDRPVTLGLFGRWFVTEAWSVSASYEWVDFNTEFVEQEDEGFLLGTRYRF